MEALGVAVNLMSVIDTSLKVASLCMQYTKDVTGAKSDIERLHTEVTDLHRIASDVQTLVNGSRLERSRDLYNVLMEGQSQLDRLEQRLTPTKSREKMHRFGIRALKWPFQRTEVNGFVEALRKSTQHMSWVLQTDQTAILLDVDQNVSEIDKSLLSIDQKVVLKSLPLATGASFDSREEQHNSVCLPDTRVDLLDQIYNWVNDPSGKTIFWLSGMAGTGKSTICRTVAGSLSDKGLLGASFFFKRGEADRGSISKFFSTISSQLARKETAIASQVKKSIDADSSIFHKASREQFDKLIMKPLIASHTELQSLDKLVLVIDALDECEDEKDIKLLINLLSSTSGLKGIRVRIFITSRPELPIRMGFNEVKNTVQDLILHEIPTETIKHDIFIYFNHELSRIRREHELPTDWPSQDDIETVSCIANPLFIVAATICRFLDVQLDPTDRLQEVITSMAKRPFSHLDTIYGFILEQTTKGLDATESAEAAKQFARVIGSIIVLAEPLPIEVLGSLIQESAIAINRTLRLLHSVIHVPTSLNSPIKLLHLSFRDFLLDQKKQETGVNPFPIDEKHANEVLHKHCLRIMYDNLKEDICNIKWPGTQRVEISDEVIQEAIPPKVRYSCQFWFHHMHMADVSLEDDGSVHKFLREKLLHWLEVMSIIGKAIESLGILRNLQSNVVPEKCPKLSVFLQDAVRLIQTNISIIDSAPLQIYSSVLIFAPNKSITRMNFDGKLPDWISQYPTVEDRWNQCLQSLEGHRREVISLACSLDSQFLASGSFDQTIRIWRPESSECIHQLKGHAHIVTSVAFSNDGQLVVSSSRDGTVRIWSLDTGKCLHTLKSLGGSVASAVFSPNSRLVASSESVVIQLWDVRTGNLIRYLRSTSPFAQCLAFSPDSTTIASTFRDHTVRKWTVEDGKCVLEMHTDDANDRAENPSAFSPDSRLVAFTSGWNINIWCMDSGNQIRTLLGYNTVSFMSFSHDSSLIASGHRNLEMRLWKVEDGQCIQIIKTTSIPRPVFLPDPTLLASAHSDGIIRLWKIEENIPNDMSSSLRYGVESVQVSPDAKIVAVRSGQTVRLWRMETNTAITKDIPSLGDLKWDPAFSSDSQMFATLSSEKSVWLGSVDDGKRLYKLEVPKRSSVEYRPECERSTILFSPDSKLISRVSSQRVLIWRTDNGELVFNHEDASYKDARAPIGFSPDSEMFAFSSGDKRRCTSLWRTHGFERINEYGMFTAGVTSISISPGSKFIGAGFYNGSIWLVRVEDGMFIKLDEFYGHKILATPMTFSSDSSLVAYADEYGAVRVKRIGGDQLIAQLQAGTGSLQMRFKPGNLFLVTNFGTLPIANTQLDGGGSPKLACSTIGFGVSDDYCWITHDGRRLLWIPIEFRIFATRLRRAPRSPVAISGSRILIGNDSGGFIVMRFDKEKLPMVVERLELDTLYPIYHDT